MSNGSSARERTRPEPTTIIGMPLAPNGWGSSTTRIRRKIFPMQTNNTYKVGDLIEMQLAFEEFASGIVVDVDTKRHDYEFPPIKIHWLGCKVAGAPGATWQFPAEIELVSRG